MKHADAIEQRDHYGDGAWYDAEYVHIRADIPYYQRVARETSGNILELACGTGRLTIPMAEQGRSVVGVDVSEAMIQRALEKRAALPEPVREHLQFTVGDMRTLRLGRSFDAVVLAFNTLMHMVDDASLRATFETVHAHLLPGGLFHFDLHTPFPPQPDQSRAPDGRYDPQEMIDPHSRERFVVTENNTYDPRQQINTMRFYYQRVDRDGRKVGPEKCAVLRLRVIFPRELDLWLAETGFEVVGEWDDFERAKPFSGLGGRRVVSARRR